MGQRSPILAGRKGLPTSSWTLSECYSITSSARAKNAGGMVTRIAVAVLRLTTRSNFVRFLHDQVGRLGTREYPVDIARATAPQF